MADLRQTFARTENLIVAPGRLMLPRGPQPGMAVLIRDGRFVRPAVGVTYAPDEFNTALKLPKGVAVLRVQPGIESFSDHVLALMRKGITSLGNVQALKWLHEFGVAVDYNILVGFPGETAADYQSALALMRRLWHLPAPGSGPTIARVDRFSPFFEEPEALGIRDVRPAAHYRHLIPVDRLAAERDAQHVGVAGTGRLQDQLQG